MFVVFSNSVYNFSSGFSPKVLEYCLCQNRSVIYDDHSFICFFKILNIVQSQHVVINKMDKMFPTRDIILPSA